MEKQENILDVRFFEWEKSCGCQNGFHDVWEGKMVRRAQQEKRDSRANRNTNRLHVILKEGLRSLFYSLLFFIILYYSLLFFIIFRRYT